MVYPTAIPILDAVEWK